MNLILPLDAPRGRARRTWTSTLLAGSLLALAPVLTPEAAAQQGGKAPSPAEANAGCMGPFPGRIPRELAPFVLPDTRAMCAAAADLNGDGLRDYVLVLEMVSPHENDPAKAEGERPLLVVVRQPGGALRVAARNDRVVYCAACGGMFGDPFEGVEARDRTFTVYHYGGSAWRWRMDYTFRFVPSAGTWRLSKVLELSYHSSAPEKMQETTFHAPDDFGDIDLADFHPERWRRNPARD